jgi:hypothetical protein
MRDFLTTYPLYIPFIILNVYIIYKVIKDVLNGEKGNNDDDDNGGVLANDQPILDLPPGVSLPVSPKEAVLNEK